MPARVQLREGLHEGLRLRLESGRRSFRILCSYGVQKRPGGTAELRNVWRAVRGEGGRCGGGFLSGFGHCEPGRDVSTGTTAVINTLVSASVYEDDG